MSKDELNRNMCKYCTHTYFGCMVDEIRLCGICGSFIKDDDADMSDCYWVKHKVVYIIVKSILYYLFVIILLAIFASALLAAFYPDVFFATVAVLAIILVSVLGCVLFYLVFRFVKGSLDDVE